MGALRNVFIWVLMILFYSCSEREIFVLDEDNVPIEGVLVSSYSLSMQNGALITDIEGKVNVPKSIQQMTGIHLRKEGYLDLNISMPEKWPVTVNLTHVK